MQIFYGFTISEYIGLVVGSITLVVLLVYYGISAIIRALKKRRTKRALDGASALCPHGRPYDKLCEPCGRVPDPSPRQ